MASNNHPSPKIAECRFHKSLGVLPEQSAVRSAAATSMPTLYLSCTVQSLATCITSCAGSTPEESILLSHSPLCPTSDMLEQSRMILTAAQLTNPQGILKERPKRIKTGLHWLVKNGGGNLPRLDCPASQPGNRRREGERSTTRNPRCPHIRYQPLYQQLAKLDT